VGSHSTLVETALSYVAHPYRPKLALNWSAIRDIIPFSRWIAATNIVVFLEAQLDNIVVARFLGTRAFGLYQGAVQTAQTPLSQLGVIAGGVLFPAFCRSGNQERLRAGFMTSLALLLYCGLPLLAFLVCYTDTIIPFLAGEQWLPMCSAVRLLAVAGLCKALMSISQALLLAQGQPHTSFLTGAFRFAGLIALLALIFPRQITGVAVAVAQDFAGPSQPNGVSSR
jgi:O-antigen/teichoic acid export membrane protein